ncbi:MAG: nitroreductase [Firmicutes bacterium]|nr:nitroreductase [Bacillota bacterium]
MELNETIVKRRAYRALAPVQITEQILSELAEAATLAPSCFNNQPWRYVAAWDPEVLGELKEQALPRGNAWAKAGSMIIAVCSQPDLDCQIKGRDYYLFDTGMATASIILKATEMDLVAHPIAGYREAKVKEILNIPREMTVITLLIVGKHDLSATELLSEEQLATEKERPARLSREQFFFSNRYPDK